MKKKGTSDLLVFGFYSCPSDVLSDFFCSDLRVVLISLFSANIFLCDGLLGSLPFDDLKKKLRPSRHGFSLK